jgi:5-methyltetrahydropteroyltriglutamate--homocysteine methyltransferase
MEKTGLTNQLTLNSEPIPHERPVKVVSEMAGVLRVGLILANADVGSRLEESLKLDQSMKTLRTSQLPPFYTQGIGSLPRPQVVRDLLAKKRDMSADPFARTMDDLVIFAIRLQEQAGLDVVSDGEWRRSQYIREFLDRVGGFERCRRFSHQGETKLTDVVVRRMTAHESVFREDARFLSAHTDRVTKFALPSPFLIAVRYWHEDHSRAAYPTVQHFLDHLAEVLAREARALVEVGIDIVQLDDPAMTYFCDRRLTEGAIADIHDERLRRTWNADRQFPEALAAIHRVAEGLRAEVHLHCCHSVYKRRSDVTGDYKPILPRLGDAKVDRLNLEFAYPGTGDVTDLALLPAHVGLGMGVIDVRSEHLQTVEQIEALGEAGARLVGPDRMALNPDCGFAPDAGEPPTIDEAYEKLRRLVAAAKRLRQRFA